MSFEITAPQKEALEEIWFIYGNNGKKSTMQNHKLIQGFIQYNEDRRAIYVDANEILKERFDQERYDKTKLTSECLKCVNLILKSKISEAMEMAKS